MQLAEERGNTGLANGKSVAGWVDFKVGLCVGREGESRTRPTSWPWGGEVWHGPSR